MGFKRFYNFVLKFNFFFLKKKKKLNFRTKCDTFSKNTNWNPLETPETLWIPYNLPGGLKEQCKSWSYGRGCLSDFSEFVNEEAILVHDPIFSREAVQEYIPHLEIKYNKYKNIRNFATYSKREIFTVCSLCEDKHNLDGRKSFKEKVLQERRKFLFKQKICYGCLSPIPAGQNATNCKKLKRKACKACNNKYPRYFPGYICLTDSNKN